MIYIENTPETQEIQVPVSYKDPQGDEVSYHFRLFSTINLKHTDDLLTADGDDLSLEVVPVMSAGGQYYKFSIELPEGMNAGTYEYLLLHGYSVLSMGVAMVGEFQNQVNQYQKEIEYEQYGAE